MAVQQQAGTGASDRDERLGEAIETYLELAESGRAPDPDSFASSYPDLSDELREALDGLALVQGLIGSGTGPGGVGARRLAAGYRVAGYRIVRELGRGGMGVVYEAVHVDLDRPVALKILGGHAAPGSNGRRRFLNEAKTAAGLHHTHIVPVFDVGQVGGLCYYAMQRIEGSGLDRVLRVLRRDRLTASGSASGGSRQAPGSTDPAPASLTAIRDDSAESGLLSLPGLTASGSAVPGSRSLGLGRSAPGDSRADDRPPPYVPPTGSEYYRWVARVGKQAAEALAYAHRRGVVHRDVKPSNLLVDARGVVWVADFGLARKLEDPGQTRGDGLVGTPRYMSPEQADGRTVGPATDIYSLGATLYELLALRPPFDGQTSAELIRQIVDREPPPLRRFARRLPRDLETIVLKAMGKRPEDRYESAAELAEDLGRFLDVEPVRARRISPIGRTWRLVQRHPVASAITACATLAILITATIAYVRIADARDEALAISGELARSLEKEKAATRAQQVARAGELLSQIPVLRASTVPRRRDQGREKLREAAALDPPESMRVLLRDEALELLAARDVEDRPPLPTGPVRGLLPIGRSSDSGRVATLSDDGQTLTLWDVHGREVPVALPLRSPPPTGGPVGPEGGEADGSPRRNSWPTPWPSLAQVGRAIAVPDPSGSGILLIDPKTGRSTALSLGGAEVIGLLAPDRGHRLVTIETIPREDWGDRGDAGPGGPGPGGSGSNRGTQGSAAGFRVRLWTLDASPMPLATLDERRFDPGSRFSLPLVELDPEGETVIIGRSAPESSLTFFDLEDGGRLAGFDAGMGLTAIAAGPDGLIATAGDGRVLLREVDPWSGSNPILLPGLIEPRGDIRRLRFNPSGRLLAAVGTYTGVELWDPSANAPVALVSTQGKVQDVTFADPLTLLVASGSTTEVWSIVEPVGRVGFEFSSDAPPRLPTFGPDGLLVMPLLDDRPRLWHPGHCPTRARPSDLPGLESAAIAFDPDGLLLAIGPDGLSRVDLSADDDAPAEVLPWPDLDATRPRTRSVHLVAQSPDRRAVLVFREYEPGPSAGPPPGPGLGPPPGPDPRRERPQDDAGSDASATTTADANSEDTRRSGAEDGAGEGGRGSRPGGSGGGGLNRRGGGREPGSLWIWRVDDQGGPGSLSPVNPRGPGPFPDVSRNRLLQTAALGPNGDSLLFLEWGRKLHVWSLDGDRPGPKPPTELERVWSLTISPDGRLLALGGDSGDARILSAETFEELAQIPPPDDSTTRLTLALAFSPDGRQLALGDSGGSMSLWEIGDPGPSSTPPRRLLRFPGRRDRIFGLAFSPDGLRLASVDFRSSEDRVVEVWDLSALRSELDELHLGW